MKKPIEEKQEVKKEEKPLVQLGENQGWERKPALIQLGAKQEK